MALRIELKPSERILIGDCVITNQDLRSTFLIEGKAPVLREKDIMTPQRANTPAKRIYLSVQMMYISREPKAYHDVYFALVRDIVSAAPSSWPVIESINHHILTGDLYKALKEARKLIAYEEKLVSHAKRDTDLRGDSEADRQPA